MAADLIGKETALISHIRAVIYAGIGIDRLAIEAGMGHAEPVALARHRREVRDDDSDIALLLALPAFAAPAKPAPKPAAAKPATAAPPAPPPSRQPAPPTPAPATPTAAPPPATPAFGATVFESASRPSNTLLGWNPDDHTAPNYLDSTHPSYTALGQIINGLGYLLR